MARRGGDAATGHGSATPFAWYSRHDFRRGLLRSRQFRMRSAIAETRSTKVPKLRELDILRCALDDDSRKELKEACAGRSPPVKLHDGTGTFERLSKVASRIRAASRLGKAVEIHQNDQAIAERNSYIFASPDERSRSRKRWASTAGLPGGRSWGNFRAVAEMLSLRARHRAAGDVVAS